VLLGSALSPNVCHGLVSDAATQVSVEAAPPTSGLKFMEAYKDEKCTGAAYVTIYESDPTTRDYNDLGDVWDNAASAVKLSAGLTAEFWKNQFTPRGEYASTDADECHRIATGVSSWKINETQ